MCTAVLIGSRPRNPPPPAFGLIYEGAIGQPRWTTSLCDPPDYNIRTLFAGSAQHNDHAFDLVDESDNLRAVGFAPVGPVPQTLQPLLQLRLKAPDPRPQLPDLRHFLDQVVFANVVIRILFAVSRRDAVIVILIGS